MQPDYTEEQKVRTVSSVDNRNLETNLEITGERLRQV